MVGVIARRRLFSIEQPAVRLEAEKARTAKRSGPSVSPRRTDRLPAWFAPLTPAEATTLGARGHRFRFVDSETATAELVLVEFRDGAPRAFDIAHLDEGKSPRLASRPIPNEVDGAHLTSGREQGLQIGFGRFVRQVADVQLRIHYTTPASSNARDLMAARAECSVTKRRRGELLRIWCGKSERSCQKVIHSVSHIRHSWDDPPEMPPKPPSVRTTPLAFDVQSFLRSAGVPQRTVRFATGAVVFAQGAQANSVFYVQEGGVKLSVISSAGKEAVVAMLGPGDFVGEGCLAGQPLRIGTATAVMKTALLRIPKRDMIRMLHEHAAFSDRFIAHMLSRNIRIEEDLVDQLFNSSEKRLARTLLLLARYGKEDTPRVLPKLSQETLAEMVGTTRSRVNFFMNKFRKLGLIEYNGGLKVNSSLLSIVLHD
jgi:CRP-like cAMP-binding protein